VRYADVAEGVRAALGTYTQALDDGRTDDVVATFCPDGACEIPGLGTHQGHDALREAYSKWPPRQPQRHLVLNTVVRDWDDDEATATSDFVFVLLEESGWAIKLVGRYDDRLHRDGDTWRFHSRRAAFVTEQHSPRKGST
jgi:hypothetical protein